MRLALGLAPTAASRYPRQTGHEQDEHGWRRLSVSSKVALATRGVGGDWGRATSSVAASANRPAVAGQRTACGSATSARALAAAKTGVSTGPSRASRAACIGGRAAARAGRAACVGIRAAACAGRASRTTRTAAARRPAIVLW
jgi:hypothetical protein